MLFGKNYIGMTRGSELIIYICGLTKETALFRLGSFTQTRSNTVANICPHFSARPLFPMHIVGCIASRRCNRPCKYLSDTYTHPHFSFEECERTPRADLLHFSECGAPRSRVSGSCTNLMNSRSFRSSPPRSLNIDRYILSDKTISSMHITQHKSCTKTEELALEMKLQGWFHRAATNAEQPKWHNAPPPPFPQGCNMYSVVSLTAVNLNLLMNE